MLIAQLKTKDIVSQNNIYIISSQSGEVLSILASTPDEIFRDVYSLKIRSNDEIVISLKETVDDVSQIRKRISEIIKELKYIPYFMPAKKMSVKCIETGEVFKTQYEAAKAHKINQSNLSKVLQNKPGHRTVQGKRYIYVENDIT